MTRALDQVAALDGRTEGHRCEDWLGFVSTHLQGAAKLIFCPGCGEKVKDRYNYAEQHCAEHKGAVIERSKAHCTATFMGGYATPHDIEVFQHGMDTVWNVIRADSSWSVVEAPDAIPRPPAPKEPALVEVLGTKLAAWLRREGPRVRDEVGYASIKFTIDTPQSDDDENLYLQARVEETTYTDEVGGILPGVKR